MRLLELRRDSSFSLTKDLIDNIPPYAILSHTWGPDGEEVTFEDLINQTAKNKAGYTKLKFCGNQAAKDKLQYFWVDTCCINKSSSSELTEAINSMFRWYREAAKCYVYLSDVSKGDNDENDAISPSFQKSRWFTRGWTLQELIAPKSVEFFSSEGTRLGSKRSMEQEIHEITGIATQALRDVPLSEFGVAERLSWAVKRKTTRKEDRAYCLLGIFGVYMPLIYGEGEEAFTRLKEHINKHPTEMIPIQSSIFTYRSDLDLVKGMIHGPQHAADLDADQRLSVLERFIIERQVDMGSKVQSTKQIGRQIKFQVAEQCLVRRQNVKAQETTIILEKRTVGTLRDPWRNTDIASFQRSASLCPQFCSCICHRSCRIVSPGMLAPLAGHLSIAVLGLYMSYFSCSETTCSRQSIPRAELSYSLPPWLLPRVLHLFVGSSPRDGPAASLRITRVVEDHAEIMNLVKAGNLEGVKSLFQRRLASPNDVNSSCEVPILNYAVEGNHIELCRFIVEQGGNPCLENRLTISALDRAWHAVLTNMLDIQTQNAFREIFSLWYDSTWIEEQQFLPLHKIVLGFSDGNLSTELKLSTSTINEPDYKGRTPTAWAAARGDDTSVRILLEHGANPNSICVTGNSPLLRAVCARSPTCISPLLRYGASVHWKSSLGFSALHYAAYYQDDDRYISPLLDFGAAIDAKDKYGWTALACAADRDNAKSGKILLERGADIESRDGAGWTPLLRSVNCNSHQVLSLLLDRKAKCSAVSSKGEGILHFAAARGDNDTLVILTNASLKNLDISAKNDGNFTAAEILARRIFNPSATASSFAHLFDKLIDSITGPMPIYERSEITIKNSTTDTETFVDAWEYQGEGMESSVYKNPVTKEHGS